MHFTKLTKPLYLFPEVHTFQGKKKDLLGNHMDEGKYSVLCFQNTITVNRTLTLFG